MTHPRSRWFTAAFAVVGIVVASYLLLIHQEVAHTGHASGLCTLGAGLDCAPAAKSEYAQLWGVPIAAIGLGFYVGVLLLALLPLQAGTVPVLLLGFVGACAYSVLLGIASLGLEAVCVGCVALYSLNVAGLLSTTWWYRHQGGAWRGLPGLLRTALAGRSPWVLLGAVVVSSALASLLDDPSGSRERHAATQRVRDEYAALPVVPEAQIRAAHAPAKGPKDAPVTIVEFSDFQCPYCARLAETLREVMNERPGLVRVEFRHFPLPFHEHAEAAARAAVCAQRQRRFWPMHDQLFARGNALSPAVISSVAAEVGLDVEQFRVCLASAAPGVTLQADRDAALALGLRGSPSFFVNGRLFVGALPRDVLIAVVDAATQATASSAALE